MSLPPAWGHGKSPQKSVFNSFESLSWVISLTTVHMV